MTFFPIGTAGCFDKEKPRDKRGFVAAFFDVGRLFFAAEVAVAVATRLDLEGEGIEPPRFRLLVGAMQLTSTQRLKQQRDKSNKRKRKVERNNTTIA
jgi:hypothetical protein